jgi:hypothetical protein
VSLIPLALLLPRIRPLGLALAIPVASTFRPGGYLPAMYVIGLLPFAALIIAGVIDWLWRPDSLHLGPSAQGGSTARRLVGATATLTACAMLAGLATLATPRWVAADHAQMTADATTPTRQAINWLSRHTSHNDRLLVDDTVWTDLITRGFDRSRTIWFYKLDLDPAVRVPWWRFDYVVRSNLLAGNLYWLPKTRQAFDNSRTVAVFAGTDERIEIRRVLKPSSRTRGPNADGAQRSTLR